MLILIVLSRDGDTLADVFAFPPRLRGEAKSGTSPLNKLNN